jgi:iron complex outermembrane receptor protein
VFANGTDNVTHTDSAILRWRPTDNIELMPFWARYDDFDDESGTYYVPAGSFVGITDRPLHDESPSWADIRFTTRNAGLLANVGLGKNTVIRLGAFRSQIHYKQLFGFLMVNQQPDGSAERLLIADPPTTNRSTSGEMRLTHSIADGPRLHVLHASVRKRDAHRAFGGSDIISYGVGAVGEKVTVPEPPSFEFGEPTRQRTEQMTYGVAYDGRWRDVGEVSVSLATIRPRSASRRRPPADSGTESASLRPPARLVERCPSVLRPNVRRASTSPPVRASRSTTGPPPRRFWALPSTAAAGTSPT